MADTYEFKVYSPRGFRSGLPQSPKEALQRTRALLKDEERWITGAWYTIDEPKIDPENPFCDDWKVCLDGALIAVTVGAHRRVTRTSTHYDYTIDEVVEESVETTDDEREWDISGDPPVSEAEDSAIWDIVQDARQLIVQAADITHPRFTYGRQNYYTSVPDVNDSGGTCRTDVMRILNKAIKLADWCRPMRYTDAVRAQQNV